MKHFLYLFIITIILVQASCSSSRFVEPLAKKQHAVGASIGGPLINFGGAVIPTPMSSVVYGYGIDSNLTAFGGLHTTALVFNNFHSDLGVTYRLFKQKDHFPALSSSLNNTIVTSLRTGTTRYWPSIDFNAYWNFSKRNHFWYLGLSNWFELRAKRAHDLEQLQRWLPNPHAGLTLKSKALQFNIEYKLLGLGQNSHDVFVPYQSIANNKGAMGLYFGITKLF
ncbi:MAG: hypothetical protein N4A35_02715 [Flavobacteriales bacterium]|jgi:hypothetical protein|nr:hypothetical protein [Flavobacteriales bacterium]